MREELAELIVEWVGLAIYGAIATALTLFGGLAEWAGVNNLLAGQLTTGGWEIAVGAIALYAGVNVVGDFVLPRVRAMRA